MKTILCILPAILACILLGAHFLRFFAFAIVAFCLFLPVVLLVKRAWAVRVVQATLVLGMLVWARAGQQFVQERISAGEPWTRLALIMGGVALFTGASAALLEAPPARRRYGLRTGDLFRSAPPDS